MSTVFQLPLSPFGLGIPEVQVAPDDSILVAQDVVRSFSRDFRQLRWTFAVPNGLLAGIEPPRLTLGDGQLFVASVGILYAVDLATGRLQWQRVVEPNANGRPLVPAAYVPAAADAASRRWSSLRTAKPSSACEPRTARRRGRSFGRSVAR